MKFWYRVRTTAKSISRSFPGVWFVRVTVWFPGPKLSAWYNKDWGENMSLVATNAYEG
jgi:hypothetical protein